MSEAPVGVIGRMIGQIVSDSDLPICLISLGGEILYANRATARRLGVEVHAGAGPGPGDAASGSPTLFDYVDPASHSRLRASIRQWKRSSTFLPGLLSVRGPHGDFVEAEVLAKAIRVTDEPGPTAILLRVQVEDTSKERFLSLSQSVESLKREIQVRTRIEREASKRARWLELAQTSAGIAVFELNRETGVFQWSELFPTFHGLAPGAGAGKVATWLERIHPGDASKVARSFAFPDCSGEARIPVHTQYRVIWPDESVHWVEIQGILLCDASGVCSSLNGVASDITERRERERKRLEFEELRRVNELLDHRETHLRLAQEAGGIATFEWYRDSGRMECSENLSSLFGGCPQSCCSSAEDCLERVHPRDREAFEHAVLRHGRDDPLLSRLQYRVRWPDGSVHWAESRSGPILDESGAVVGARGTVVDVTEQKSAELEIVEKNRLIEEHLEDLNLIQDAAGIATFQWDRKKRVLSFSRKYPELFGIFDAEGESAVEPWFERIHSDHRERIRHGFRHVLAHPDQPTFGQFKVCWPDGSTHWVEVRSHAATGDGGRSTAVRGTLMNIDEIKQKEAEVLSANDELEARVESRTIELGSANTALRKTVKYLELAQGELVESQKMAALGSLVAGVAHEINTPLGVSVTAASHLADATTALSRTYAAGDMTRSALERYLEIASDSARILGDNLDRASGLIRSFKMSAVDQSSGDVRDLDLRDYVDEILASLRPTLRKSAVTVFNAIPTCIVITANAGVIAQIVTNLVMNALLHAFDPGTSSGEIRFEATVGDDGVSLRVRDNGNGMSEANRARVFEPFFTTARGRGGSGLGLSIVYNLVTTGLKGNVTCTTELGAGTTFEVTMPRTPEPPRVGKRAGADRVEREPSFA